MMHTYNDGSWGEVAERLGLPVEVAQTQQEIRALRRVLKESTAEFAARFGVSRRTVEAWEQGRNRPHPTVSRALQALRAQQEQTS